MNYTQMLAELRKQLRGANTARRNALNAEIARIEALIGTDATAADQPYEGTFTATEIPVVTDTTDYTSRWSRQETVQGNLTGNEFTGAGLPITEYLFTIRGGATGPNARPDGLWVAAPNGVTIPRRPSVEQVVAAAVRARGLRGPLLQGTGINGIPAQYGPVQPVVGMTAVFGTVVMPQGAWTENRGTNAAGTGYTVATRDTIVVPSLLRQETIADIRAREAQERLRNEAADAIQNFGANAVNYSLVMANLAKANKFASLTNAAVVDVEP
jgi:hypothetical protein